MKITKKDVGRKVVDEDGNIAIVTVYLVDDELPVNTHYSNYTVDGKSTTLGVGHLVKFLDEEEGCK